MERYSELLQSFSKYSHLEQYQDIVIDGITIKKGIRSCQDRLAKIIPIASTWRRPFTVLDIGANLGYFSLHLAKNYNCTVVALEGIYGDWLKDIASANSLNNIIILNKVFTIDDLKTLSEIEHFDLVLALNVIHHIDGDYQNILDIVCNLGDISIVELAVEDNACGQSVVKQSYIPVNSKLIGYCDSHLANTKRPLFLMESRRTTFDRAYLDTPLDDLNLTIISSFGSKVAIKGDIKYDWHRGINLKTWIAMGGTYPETYAVKEMIMNRKPEINHGDLFTHNIIIQGDDVQFIDQNDSRRDRYDDNITLEEVMKDLDS